MRLHRFCVIVSKSLFTPLQYYTPSPLGAFCMGIRSFVTGV